eukprot:TRINITY_DN6422_c0_g1_i1.p1 TRINITY_DN6422_c0_g1~~TRINITY_DN6422_c0_g1_i1.p1  ORF type:complete len:274 (+),score=39.08 TRINITY_DN6422_c0_g1_i1:39-860(+)
MLNNVETKIPAVLICEHRKLRDNEKPKRKGQTTVYEATGGINSNFLEMWRDPNLNKVVTVKHDGMCSKFEKSGDKVILYRRYDVRKGNVPPSGSTPAGTNDDGEVEFYWIDVTNSRDPGDQYFLSALTKKEEKQFVSLIVPSNSSPGWEIVDHPLEDIMPGTYELIGPKVQNNRYNLPTNVETSVVLDKKGKDPSREYLIPKHYYVRHGAFVIDDEVFNPIGIDYPSLKDFILNNNFEGLVFHFSNTRMFKINRGHIGEELKESDYLRFNVVN